MLQAEFPPADADNNEVTKWQAKKQTCKQGSSNDLRWLRVDRASPVSTPVSCGYNIKQTSAPSLNTNQTVMNEDIETLETLSED